MISDNQGVNTINSQQDCITTYGTSFFFRKKKTDEAGVLAMFPCVRSFVCSTFHG
jgi:hypothetical protein